jgi:hypothetical protein
MTTINIPVAASSDDAYENNAGTVTLNGVSVGAQLNNIDEWAGFRFLNVTIPAATINSASMSVIPTSTGNDEPIHPIYGEDQDNPATFAVSANNISGRARTTATVTWTNANLGATGTSRHDSDDISTIIQEIVDRAGWASGNALVLIIQGVDSGLNRQLDVKSYDSAPADAAELDVDFTADSVTHNMAATVAGVSTAAGAISVDRSLAAAIAAVSDLPPEGGLTWHVEWALAAAVAAVSTAAGAVSVDRPIAATVASDSGVAGALGVDRPLAALAAAVSAVTSALTVGAGTVSLEAIIASESSVAAALILDLPFAAAVASDSSVAGEIDVLRPLAAGIASESGVSASMILDMLLAAAIAGESSVSGILGGLRTALVLPPGLTRGPRGNITGIVIGPRNLLAGNTRGGQLATGQTRMG